MTSGRHLSAAELPPRGHGSDQRPRRPGFFRRHAARLLPRRLQPLPPGALPLAASDVAYPRGRPDELRITWIGHSTFLIQAGSLNILTDPMWSRRASPVPWAGPARLAPPGLPLEALPPIDAVLVSHDHYDHLDDATVRRLHARFGDAVRWFTPGGYTPWFRRRRIRNVTELAWWAESSLDTPDGPARVVALPARHWARRSLIADARRLWASWALILPGGNAIYFAGDSAYFPGFAEIGERLGPFDASLLPIGAYEPRWFMQTAHMDPDEAVQAYADLGGRGTFVGMHWGTFRLSNEDPLEPPHRTRRAWAARNYPGEDLWILRHGETRTRRLTVRSPRNAGP
jgi:N-acyl-phosphatidylethanolamine-hydrolysing phospholipase D